MQVQRDRNYDLICQAYFTVVPTSCLPSRLRSHDLVVRIGDAQWTEGAGQMLDADATGIPAVAAGQRPAAGRRRRRGRCVRGRAGQIRGGRGGRRCRCWRCGLRLVRRQRCCRWRRVDHRSGADKRRGGTGWRVFDVAVDVGIVCVSVEGFECF